MAEVSSSTTTYGTLQNPSSDEDEEGGVDGFHDRSLPTSIREALWSPPVDYLNDDRQMDAPYKDIAARREARKLAIRKRSSSFVVVPSRLTTATFNLTNTIIGSGTLAMPYAAMSSGLCIFPFLVAITGVAAHYAVLCLFNAVENLKGSLRRPRYPSLGRATLGWWGEQIASWSVTFQQLGACIAYIIIIGDVLFPVVSQVEGVSLLCHRWFLQVAIVCGIIFPLCLIPSMDRLKYASIMSLSLIAVTVAVVVGNGFYVLGDSSLREELVGSGDATNSTIGPKMGAYCENLVNGGKRKLLLEDAPPASGTTGAPALFPPGLSFLSALPILAFGFLCHMNTFPIYRELERASVRRMGMVSRRSMTIVGSTYALMGVFGYLTFLGYTEDDILKNFKFSGTYISTTMNIVRVGFGVSMILSFPLMIWEARHNVDVLLFATVERKKLGYSFWRFLWLNIGLLALITSIAIAAPGVSPVIELIGSTCSPIMMYILPATFLLQSQTTKWCRRENAKPLCLLGTGALLIPLCVFVWIMKHIVCSPEEQKYDGDSELCKVLF